MYYKINNNLKQYYRSTQELINRIKDINKHFNAECEIIDCYFKLMLIYKNEVVKINIAHTDGRIENLNYIDMDKY